jgi:hypothetical protein
VTGKRTSQARVLPRKSGRACLATAARTCLQPTGSAGGGEIEWKATAFLSLLLPRKEVIQAHLPVHLPCYDFVPVTSPTLDGSLLAVRIPASGVTSSHDVTGGVYKARERIHRSIADLRLLATPSSCRRVAACNLN